MKRVIYLSGPEGNVLELIAIARTLGRRIGLSDAERLKIQNDMSSRDYDYAVQVFRNAFDDHVDIKDVDMAECMGAPCERSLQIRGELKCIRI